MHARFIVVGAATAALLAPLLYDAAIKGLALLTAAGLVVLGLRGASAAARHLVWLVAVVALLAVPMLTVALPRWRVLPSWVAWPAHPKEPSSAGLPVEPLTGTGTDTLTRPVNTPIEAVAFDAEPLIAQPPAPIPAALSAPLASDSPRFSIASASTWAVAIWAGGCLILSGRLLAAQCLLRRARRRAEPCRSGPLVDALAEAANQLDVRQSVSLRLDAGRTIPLVWGVMRPCLLLPAEAGEWSRDQLRSVLLHELAHLKRRDPLVQVLMQGALALHWFNPLAWLAAWRLHVERERACDDLVLASGVRGSEYATHLLRVATELTPAPWTSACGLAMARRSSLEGRLRAVLNEGCNRRGITRALTAAALFLALAISIPVAMLRAAEEAPLLAAQPPQESQPTVMEPKIQEARSLFQKWRSRARTDGRIPGALIGLLARQTENYIQQYPDTPEASRLAALRSRLDATRDWPPAEAAGLLDEVAGIATAPVGWTSLPMEFDAFRTVVSGEPLPIELSSAAWGPPAENGLRAAWLLKPRAGQYALGTVLNVRVLFHNAGTQPVVFRTETWHQSDTLTVRDAQGADVKTTGTRYTGITPLAVYRLLPGEYCEVGAPGVAIGAGTYEDERSTGRLGIVIEAKAGDELSLFCTVDAAQGITFSRTGDPNDPLELWRMQVAERVASEAPLPGTAADREQLIRRVVLDLTGEPPTAEEIAVFVADPAPDALQSLTARLQAKQPTLPWTGKLQSGTTTFRVLPADPNAAKAPRSANAPGRYVLGDTVHLQVTQTTGDDSRRNKATLLFLSPDPKVTSPHTPYEISLPDGNGTYGMVWERGAGVLWVLEKDIVRRYDFGNPAKVGETRIQPGSLQDIPIHLRDAMQQVFTVDHSPEPPRGQTLSTTATTIGPATESQLDWGEPVNGLRGALLIRSPEAGIPGAITLAVQNVSDAPVRFMDTTKSKRLRSLYVSASGSTLFALSNDEPTMTDVILQPREVVFLSMMREDGDEVTASLIEGLRKDSLQTWRAVLDMSFSVLGGGWSGTLTTGETRVVVREGGPHPKNERAQALFKHWLNSTRLNGDIPGGLVALLHAKVKEFIRNNEPDASGGPFAQKMKPLEPRFTHTGDWKAADVVALLDDIAAAHTIPLDNTLRHLAERTLQPGTPLPPSLENEDWGEPLPSGLRMAHVLEPRANGYHLGTELKARILLHNAGREPVAFLTDTFQQPGHAARRADGSDLKLDSTYWTTLGSMAAYRLAPGEYCEINTPGLGIGPRVEDRDDWANVRAGSWILCAEGDDVVFTPGAAQLSYREGPEKSGDWWLEFITERLNREAPVPTDPKERAYLLYRVVRDLYGAAPSTTQGDAFAADTSPDALKNLAALLAKHPYGKQSDGVIRAGSTRFRVLPPDADAASRPRVATGPGWYTLGENLRFSVTRRAFGNRVINEAKIVYFQQAKENVRHSLAKKIPLPDGRDTWAAATMKGATELWIAEAGTLRRYDFANPLQPVETRYEGGKIGEAPISNELRAALDPIFSRPATELPKRKEPSAPPAADKPAVQATGEIGGASKDADGTGNTVFISRETKRPLSTMHAGDGVTLAIEEQVFHGADVMTQVRLRYNAEDGTMTGHDVSVAMDAFGNREHWAFLWVPGTKTFWHVNGGFDGKRLRLHRTDFADPRRIVTSYDANYEGEELDGLGIPSVVRATFETHFGVPAPKAVDKSGGLPDVAGEYVAAARPVKADGSLPPIRGVPQSATARWKVRFVDAEKGLPVPFVKMRLTRIKADGSRKSFVTRLVSEAAPLEPDLDSDEYGFITIVDAALTNADSGVRLFGNVPADLNADETHTNSALPFVVKVKPVGVSKLYERPGASPSKPATARLTPESLLGTWRGMVNGENLMLSFHRPPGETDAQLDIYFGEATIGALADFTIAEDGGSAEVLQRSPGGGMKFGTLVPRVAGQLELRLFGRQKGQQEVTLTRDTGAVTTEPRQKEARELFDLWKATANADGTIPGTFIGALATEVRAYVKSNPTLDSATKLPKLLPRFVTSRDWTPAEAIQLLDDVAYYSTAPIEARAAKARQPSGPLWRTMVEFQDIPVEIASWSEAKDGLRIGLRVVGGQWSAGGSVRAELWLHNAGAEDVSFRTAGPNRQDVEVMFSAIDGGGQEHWPEHSPLNIFAPLLDCVLPAGHVAMAKEFDVTFADADNDMRTPLGARFRDLKPGPYQLRCSLLVAKPKPASSGEHIELTAPKLEFTLAPAATENEPHNAEAPGSAIAPAPARAQGGPRAEVKPERTHFWNDTHAAVALQTDKDVHFVLVAEGFLSTGLSESFSSTGRWSIEGNIHLVDPDKTRAAGRNVDKRVIALKHTSDEPTKLYLDGKAYDLAASPASGAKGVAPLPGRLFILRAEGEPIQTARTLPLRNEKDLVTISDYAVRGGFMMENEAARPKEPN